LKVKSGIIYNGLQTIAEFTEKPMPISLVGKLLRLTDDLTKENGIIDKQRQIIIEKYGDKDENGELIVTDGNISFTNPEAAENVQKELDELANLEVEIKDRMITEEDLEEADLKLSLAQFAILRNFLHSEENIEE